MNVAIFSAAGLAATAGNTDVLFRAPWDDLDDAALLAHYRSARTVSF